MEKISQLNNAQRVQLSKFISLVLRHQPELIGLALGPQGWVEIDQLIAKSAAADRHFDREALMYVVNADEKQRFTISEDGLRIRAAQGHSVSVELGLQPQTPPPKLYHGTATRFRDAILSEGLKPQSRQQVHLSADTETALRVGQRHGKPCIFKVDAQRMHEDGLAFFVADNGVWLTDHVPARYLTLMDEPRPA